MKLQGKSSTVGKYLNSMTSLINFNIKLIAKKSRRPQRIREWNECILDENENKSIVLSENESSSCSDIDSNDNKDDIKSTSFIVFWLSLIIFFEQCFSCSDKFLEITRKVRGSLIIIMTCFNGPKNTWRSQPSINCQSLGNIWICSETLFSGNTFQNIYDFLNIVGLQCIGKTRFHQFQGKYLAVAV